MELYTDSNQSNFPCDHLLVKLLISGEDHRFKYHIGFDIYAMMRAIKNRLFFSKREGASTIEQQLVRILTNDFRPTFTRKIQEILLAACVSKLVPKSKVPVLYLMVAYYGTEMKNFNQLLVRFKIQDYQEISLDLAAEIISRIKYPEPSRPSPKRMLQIAQRKHHLIHLFNKHSSRKIFTIYG